MDKIRYRDLQRWKFGDIEQVLPIAITYDSQAKMVLLTLGDYNKLVKLARNRSDSQAINPALKGKVGFDDGHIVVI